MMTRTLLALTLIAPFAAGCTTETSVEDELATDDASEGDDTKADSAGGTYTYYQLTPDVRLCTAPSCGGVYYRLANARSTRCSDGTKQDRCYAPFVDWSKLGLGDAALGSVQRALGAGTLLVRAKVGSTTWQDLGSFPELVPSEAWIGQGPNEAHGPIARIEDTGVTCFAAPCPTYRERKLNSSVKAMLAELDWDASNANEAQIASAVEAMNGTGLLVAGDRYTVTGPAGEAKARTVTQFWLRATDEATTCVVTGCSGQICADRHMASTCEFLPEYACYGEASCEVQPGGECGWTPTTELETCIAEARN